MLIYLAMMKECYLYSQEERSSDYNSDEKESAAGCQHKTSSCVIAGFVTVFCLHLSLKPAVEKS